MEQYRYFIVDVANAGNKDEGDIIVGQVQDGFVVEVGTGTAYNLNDVTPLVIR